MKSTLYFYIVIFFLLLQTEMHGKSMDWQDMAFFNMLHGLPESRIRDILPQDDGSVILATTSFICLFDGNNFIYAPVPENNVTTLSAYDGYRKLATTSDSLIWLKNRNTLHIFNPLTLQSIDRTNQLLKTKFGIEYAPIDIYPLDSCLISISENYNLYVSTQSKNKFVADLAKLSEKKQTPQQIIKDGDNLYLCYNDGTVCTVSLSKGNILFMSHTPDCGIINQFSRGIIAKSEGNTLAMVRNDIKENRSEIHILDIRTKTWINSLTIPFRISDFIYNDDGVILAVGNDGYVEVNPSTGSWKHHNIATLMPELVYNDLSSVAKDKNNGIWIGMADGGLMYHNPKRLDTFTLINNTTASKKFGNRKFNNKREESLARKYASGTTNCSLTDEHGTVYLGTRCGLMIFAADDSLIGILDKSYGLPSDNIQSLLLLKDDELLGTTSNSLFTVVKEEDQSFSIESFGYIDGLNLGGKELIRNGLDIDSLGNIMIYAPNGVYTVNKDSLQHGTHRIYHLRKHNATNKNYYLLTFTPLVVIISITIIFYDRIFRKTSPQSDPDSQTYADSTVKNDVTDEIDKSFSNKLTGLILENLSNEDFSVVGLSSLMAMERTVLYRKTHANLGMSPSAYIKELRITEAKKLLEDTDLQISEISSRCGFSTPRYFTQVFKAATDMTPSQYRQRK